VIADIFLALPVVVPVGILTGEFHAVFSGQAVPQAVYWENALAGWVWFFVLNTYLLMKYGQTVGKRFLDIRISDHRTEAVPPFWRLLVRIAVPPLTTLLGALGGLLSLMDVLFIFRKDRRCVHDFIAGTHVVRT
jgi:uncharacterized RDD family membrane protein YckC